MASNPNLSASLSPVWRLSDFAVRTAVAMNRVPGVEFPRLSRTNAIGLAWRGFLNVPASGTYTSHLTSDGGAALRLHDATVIDDDFSHTGAEVSGAMQLQAGPHPFWLYYRHASGPTSLRLEYCGPDIPRIPVLPLMN